MSNVTPITSNNKVKLAKVFSPATSVVSDAQKQNECCVKDKHGVTHVFGCVENSGVYHWSSRNGGSTWTETVILPIVGIAVVSAAYNEQNDTIFVGFYDPQDMDSLQIFNSGNGYTGAEVVALPVTADAGTFPALSVSNDGKLHILVVSDHEMWYSYRNDFDDYNAFEQLEPEVTFGAYTVPIFVTDASMDIEADGFPVLAVFGDIYYPPTGLLWGNVSVIMDMVVEVHSGSGEITLVASADASMASASPNSNNGTSTLTSVGDDGYGVRGNVTLVKFPLVSGMGANEIPPGAKIVDAKVGFFVNYSDAGGGGGIYYTNWQVRLYRILQEWSETQVTWNNRKTGTPWTSGGAGALGVDRESVYSANHKLDKYMIPTSGRASWRDGTMAGGADGAVSGGRGKLLKDIEDILNGLEPNNGWGLYSEYNMMFPDWRGYNNLMSRETADSTKRPELYVKYSGTDWYTTYWDNTNVTVLDFGDGSGTVIEPPSVKRVNGVTYFAWISHDATSGSYNDSQVKTLGRSSRQVISGV